MPTPANRAKIQLVRGSYSNISASIADLVDGELCYAKDQNRLYMVEGNTLTVVEAEAEGVEDTIAAALAGGTGIDITYDDPVDTITVDLADTAVTPAQYGSSSAIPIITVDQQGRITGASTASISTDMTVAADSGSNETIAIGTDTFTIAGGTGLTTTTTTDKVTVDLDDTAVTPSGYGSSTAIPVITIDQQGRITAASTTTVAEQTSTTGNFTVGGELRGPSTFYIDPSAYGDDTGTVVIRGGLTVNGTTTTIESTTLTVDDKNIELGTVATPTDSTADGGGITLKGATDKTINWVDSTDAWTLSEHVNIADTKEYRMNGTAVLAYSGSDKILDNVIVDGGTY